jgi:hypothetical protein
VSYWNSTGKQAVGMGQTALVVAPATGKGSARAVAFTVVGMNGQSLLGPTFVGGDVSWFYGCAGFIGGCGGPQAGSWRYSLSSRSYQLATSKASVVSYAALPNGSAAEVLMGAAEGCGIATSAAQPCSVVQTAALSYRKARKPSLPIRLAS